MMNQSQFLAITCNWLEAQEKSRVHGAIGFVFASHWLKNWRDSFKPITKRSNHNHVIAFDSHLKTALCIKYILYIIHEIHVLELGIEIRFWCVVLIFFSYTSTSQVQCSTS